LHCKQEHCKFPQGICKEFFKFAKLMRKIPNELRSQKGNASHSLPVIDQIFWMDGGISSNRFDDFEHPNKFNPEGEIRETQS
jgi:hypothetical protein